MSKVKQDDKQLLQKSVQTCCWCWSRNRATRSPPAICCHCVHHRHCVHCDDRRRPRVPSPPGGNILIILGIEKYKQYSFK